ncbi:MAG: D-glucuronyl C5-epimerase family protein [Candidatus Thermoplasmatota archaeon]
MMNKEIDQKLGKYYIDMKVNLRKPKLETYKFDDDNILLYKIPYTENYDHYPVTIAQYGLGNYEKYLDTKDKKYYRRFLKQVEWLVDNINIENDLGVWEHYYTLPFYEFNRIPWVHGMGQSIAISVLLRAFQETKDEKYLNFAKKAFNVFDKKIKNNGVLFRDEEENIWLEEYAILPPPHILNGFIFIVFGINEYYKVTKSKKSLTIFNKCLETIEKNIALYDTGYWSKYNLLQDHPADDFYHDLHIKQLNALYRITKKDIFKFYAKKWKDYSKKPFNRYKKTFVRVLTHIRLNGIIGCIKKYKTMRKWHNK